MTPPLSIMLMPAWRGSAEKIRHVATAVEAAGYHSIWVNEHVVVPAGTATRYPYRPDGKLPISPDAPWTDAMVTLGFLAAATTRVRLGSAVIPIITRDPLSLASQAATVDVLTSGRLELGLGAGWLVEEATALGQPSDRRFKRLEETIAILRLAWSGTSFDYHGQLYDLPEVTVAPSPVQGEQVPIWVGGASPTAIRLAACLASGLLLSISAMLPPNKVAEIAETLRSGGRHVRLMAPVDADQAGASERALALHAAGADIVMAVSNADASTAIERFEELAQDLHAI